MNRIMVASSESTKAMDGIDVNIEHDNESGTGTNVAPTAVTASTATITITTGTTTSNAQDHDTRQQQTTTVPSTTPMDKVKIHFVAVGSAPILKRTKFQINADQRFAAVHVFLRKLLKLPSLDDNNSIINNGSSSSSTGNSSQNNLFLYCCSAFVPSPDHSIGELRDSFANAHTKELVIHYSLQEAWG